MSSAVGGDGRRTIIARLISIGLPVLFDGVLNGNAIGVGIVRSEL
jgi:hypothetical protein